MKTYISIIAVLSGFLFSCTEEAPLTDATGVFEATEVIVSAEAVGNILVFNAEEGNKINRGQTLGLIDSTQLHLSKLQLEASKQAILAGLPDIRVQVEATEKEIAKQQREKERLRKLLAGDVATQQQMDNIESAIEILQARLQSQKSSLSKGVNAADAQIKSIDVQIAQLEDRIAKCNIKSPIDGTVLVKYAEQGELAAAGKPLFVVADIEHMILKAYVTADQLDKLRLGQAVTVLAEFGEEENRPYEGKITWISSKAEFTPKTIQTQDQRANLVYAVKVAVKNDELLKIGMYGGFKLAE